MIVFHHKKPSYKPSFTPTKIDPEKKAIWVAELRRGDLNQTQGLLATYNVNTEKWGFCCLGVGTEIYQSLSGKPMRERLRFHRSAGYYISKSEKRCIYGASEDSEMPYEVAMWFGLDEYTTNHLAELNDSGYTFKEIADWIEKYL